jgi:hypothetical protein
VCSRYLTLPGAVANRAHNLLKGYAEAGALDGEHRAFTEVAVN